ncbi:ecdysone 20-monooxygenase-like [Saccostrea cucullata]|uniref:ecdysone 20-monooxygenase-like n=1 Tax=Saccostrea cuccullata TaxID=36930 RepID=UPI002ED64FED
MKAMYKRCLGYLQLRRYSSNAAATFSRESPDVKPFKEIPGATGKFTIPYYIGNTFLLKSLGCSEYPVDLKKLMTGIHKRYGDIARIRTTTNKWGVFLFHPDFAKEVLEIQIRNPFRPPIDILRIYNEKENLSQSLATLNGEEWAKLRKPSQELILRPVAVSAYVGSLSKVADDFVEKYIHGG